MTVDEIQTLSNRDLDLEISCVEGELVVYSSPALSLVANAFEKAAKIHLAGLLAERITRSQTQEGVDDQKATSTIDR